MKRLLRLVFYLPFLVSAAEARTWLVKADGSGDAPTIQAAISAGSSGDSIIIAAGVYNENLDTLGKFLTLKGEGGASATILDGGRRGSVIRFTGGGTIEGLTVRNGQAFAGGGVFVSDSNAIEIRFNIIEGNFAGFSIDEGEGGGVYLDASTDAAVLEMNVIRNNSSAYAGGGVYDHGGFTQPNSIRDNTITGNWCYVAGAGVRMFAGQLDRNVIANNHSDHFGGGVAIEGDGTAEIRNNTIVGNRVGNFLTNGAGIHNASEQAHILGNVVTDNRHEGFLPSDSGAGIFCMGPASAAEVLCNDTWNNDLDGIVGIPVEDPSNFSRDPVFCDAAQGKYELATFSPCLPQNNGCAALLGARGLGCTVSDVDAARPVVSTLSISPNPPHGSATITYRVAPGTRTARLAVYDLRGRLVAQLSQINATLSPGSVTWDGRDSARCAVSAGIYIVRLETENGAISRKIAWVR